ncbi:ABC transporter permease [Streptococcus anginosus]|uniref:ABC transporter permease n=1 Tax=Streptococcus anginosus TaxID=1328 RepID=UPI0021F83E42|nr:ABC transporter permease [Streptococcus anginosus]MCW0946096.1 ABC transporter permease [Streptococcus anginosus]
MIYRMLHCEFIKIRRNPILLVGFFAVLISVGYSVFQMYLGYNAGEEMSFEILNYVLVFNNTTLVFPATFTLFGGYLINREYEADTMKSLLTVPISLRKIFIIKILITGIFSVFFGLISFILVMLSGQFLLHFDITLEQTVFSIKQVCGMALFNYITVSPIIILSTRKRGYYMVGAGISFLLGLISLFVGKSSLTNFFPITAGYKLVDYAAAYETANPLVSIAVYLVIILILAICIHYLPPYDDLIIVSKKNGIKKRV